MGAFNLPITEALKDGMMNLSVAADAAAAVIMIVLMIKAGRYYQKTDLEGMLFLQFSRTVFAFALVDLAWGVFSQYTLPYHPGEFSVASPSGKLLIILYAIVCAADYFLSSFFLFLWIVYATYRLYHSRDLLKRRFWFGVAPLILSTAAAIAAMLQVLFAGKGGLLYLGLTLLMLAVQCFYFVISIVMLQLYKKQNGYLRFFNIKAFCIPVIIGILLDFVLGSGFRALFAAVGILLMLASVMKEHHYTDSETGFYNTNYIGFIRSLMQKNEYEAYSALVFRIPDGESVLAASKALGEQLPKDCEPVRNQKNEIIVLAPVRDRTLMDMIMEDIKDTVSTEAFCLMRKTDETREGFLDRVFEKQPEERI